MTQTKASRDRAKRKVDALIFATIQMRDEARGAMPPRQEMRLLAAHPLPPFTPVGREIYSYRASRESPHHHRGRQRRIARYAGFGAERRRAFYLVTRALAQAGDAHAANRAAHIRAAATDAGDAWIFEMHITQQEPSR